jgi:ATP-dependent RNA helicase DDX35
LTDTLSNKTLHVHPSSVLFTRMPATGFVVFHEVIETSKSFMRDLTVIDQVQYIPVFYFREGSC